MDYKMIKLAHVWVFLSLSTTYLYNKIIYLNSGPLCLWMTLDTQTLRLAVAAWAYTCQGATTIDNTERDSYAMYLITIGSWRLGHKRRCGTEECGWFCSSHDWTSTLEHRSRVRGLVVSPFPMSPFSWAVLLPQSLNSWKKYWLLNYS